MPFILVAAWAEGARAAAIAQQKSEAAAYRWNNLLQQDVIDMPEIGVEANMR